MKNSVFLWSLLLIVWLLAGSFLYHKLCCEDSISSNAIGGIPALNISDNEDLKISGAENFSFNVNEFDLRALPKSVEQSFGALVKHLKEKPSAQLELNGRYLESETNGSIYPDLGIARANEMKNWFLENGIESNRFELNSARLIDSSALVDSVLYGIVDFGFSEKSSIAQDDSATESETEEDPKEESIVEKLNFKPLTLYFETNASQIGLNADQRQSFADIIRYLDQNSSAVLEIGGHADNSGSRAYNLDLSQQRADFVEKYLVRNGIPANRMQVIANGPDKPIASNNTEAGKSKNRRVEIILK